MKITRLNLQSIVQKILKENQNSIFSSEQSNASSVPGNVESTEPITNPDSFSGAFPDDDEGNIESDPVMAKLEELTSKMDAIAMKLGISGNEMTGEAPAPVLNQEGRNNINQEEEILEMLKEFHRSKEKLKSMSFENLSDNILTELKNLAQEVGSIVKQRRAPNSKETPKAPLKQEAKKSWEPNKKVFEKRKEERMK